MILLAKHLILGLGILTSSILLAHNAEPPSVLIQRIAESRSKTDIAEAGIELIHACKKDLELAKLGWEDREEQTTHYALLEAIVPVFVFNNNHIYGGNDAPTHPLILQRAAIAGELIKTIRESGLLEWNTESAAAWLKEHSREVPYRETIHTFVSLAVINPS